jgi:hypothetical protein
MGFRYRRFWLGVAVLAWLAGLSGPAAATPHEYGVCFETMSAVVPLTFASVCGFRAVPGFRKLSVWSRRSPLVSLQ